MEIVSALGSVFGLFGKLFNDIICYPLGAILKVCYSVTGNYAISLIIFTLITRLFLFPLAIKQQKSSAEMLRMKPKMDQLQKKYSKDKVKLQEEMSKLYQEEGYSPLSGCLPLLIQMPILYGLFTVVYNPLTYILWYSQDKIDKIASILRPYINLMGMKNFNDGKIQLYIAKAMGGHMDKLGFLGSHVQTIDFSLFGIDLSKAPGFGLNLFVLIPILCYLSSALSTYLSMRMNRQVQGQMANGMNSTLMVFLMPLMSAWFATSFPGAVGFYWIITNLFMVVQVLILQKYFSLDKLAEKAKIESEQRRQDILSGKRKPSRFAEMTKRALEAQQAQNQQGISSKNETSSQEADEQQVKLNSKGQKSRSQIKEEHRRKLSESRSQDNKK